MEILQKYLSGFLLILVYILISDLDTTEIKEVFSYKTWNLKICTLIGLLSILLEILIDKCGCTSDIRSLSTFPLNKCEKKRTKINHSTDSLIMSIQKSTLKKGLFIQVHEHNIDIYKKN